jgi:cis-L-3-hydroxyproline dehydratase
MHAMAFHQWVTIRTAGNAPPLHGGRMRLPDGDGLGINVDTDLLGRPYLAPGR